MLEQSEMDLSITMQNKIYYITMTEAYKNVETTQSRITT